MGLRVSLLEEIIGADRIEHGIADINDPEGVLQIRRLLLGGAKIRLAQTRQRVFSLKQPRHRNGYTFSDPNAKAKGASVSNGNSSLASRDHVYTLRKRIRQAQYLNTGCKKLHGWLVIYHIFIHCSTNLIKQGSANVADNF